MYFGGYFKPQQQEGLPSVFFCITPCQQKGRGIVSLVFFASPWQLRGGGFFPLVKTLVTKICKSSASPTCQLLTCWSHIVCCCCSCCCYHPGNWGGRLLVLLSTRFWGFLSRLLSTRFANLPPQQLVIQPQTHCWSHFVEQLQFVLSISLLLRISKSNYVTTQKYNAI